jgi:hypothetical protein
MVAFERFFTLLKSSGSQVTAPNDFCAILIFSDLKHYGQEKGTSPPKAHAGR